MVPQPLSNHEKRAQDVADSLRRYLIGFNTGGIGAMLAAAASLASLCVAPNWIVPAFVFFSSGLVVTLISLVVQKHKALERRDAEAEGRPQPDFTKGFWRNNTWDLIALAAFIGGLIFALSALSSIQPGCG